MKLRRPEFNPLLAFGVTVAVLLVYLIVLMVAVSAQFFPPSMFALGIWLLLPLISVALYFWLSPNERTNTGRRYFRLLAAALVAPLASAGLSVVLWFVVLGRSM